MEKLLNFVLLFSFAFCQANRQECAHYIETIVDIQSLNYDGNIKKCRHTNENGRLTFINCNNNDINSISQIIAQAKNVTTIDISHSGLHSIDEIYLLEHRQLKKFIASHNNLKEFPTSCIRNAPAIEEIDLSANHLREIEINAFIGISKLTTINLSSNDITHIDEHSFSVLGHLTYLDLSNNHISSLSGINFCLSCVVSLHLEANPFEILEGNNFPTMTNTLIYFTWSTIAAIDLRKRSGRFRVNFDDENDAIFGRSNGNSQYEIHCGDQSFKVIQSLIIAKNQIENVSTMLQCVGSWVQTLILSGNFLGSLNRTTFQRFTQLRSLLVANTQLAEFDFSTMSMANNYIVVLDISENGLTYASNASAIKELQWLETFKADGNHIQNIPELIHYINPRTMHELDLSDNVIGPLSRTTFEKLTELTILKLRNTQMTITDFNPFEQLQQIRRLDISHNNLEGVNFALMADTLRKLLIFHASYCQIRNISEVIQYLNGDIVVTLDLSGNSGNNLNKNLFKSFSSLNTLILSHLSIKHLAPDTIQRLHAIEKFDISNNELRELDCGLMPQNIQEFYINNNRLRRITNLNEHRFSALTKLDVAENCLTADQVMQIKENLTSIEFLTDPFIQKSNEKCAAYDRRITSPRENKIGIVIIIVVSFATLIIIIGIYVAYRMNIIGKLKKANKTSETTTEPNSNQFNQNPSITSNEIVTPNEPIYEELDELPYVPYDKLWHEFQPMPLTEQTRQTYDTMINKTLNTPVYTKTS